MKNWQRYLIGIGFGVALVLILLAFFCGKKQGSKNSDLIAQEYQRQLDSIRAIPIKHTIDTVIIYPDPEIKWFTHYDTITIYPDSIHFEQDSMVTDDLTMYVVESIKGAVNWRLFGYKLFIPQTITITDSIMIPVPVIQEKPVYSYYDGLWLGANIGGGSEFAYSVGLDYSKGKNQFGVEYMRFGGTNNWMLGYKRLIFQRK